MALNSTKQFCLFDEISSGLDYQHRQELEHTIRKKTTNSTVLSVSHYFEELQGWATHVLLLSTGKLKYFGSIKEFYAAYPHRLTVKLPLPADKLLKPQDLDKYDYAKKLVFFSTDAEAEKFTDMLKLQDVSYTIGSQSLASTYSYALGKGIGSSEKISQ